MVSLDGPGGSGKSTVGMRAAGALGYRFCDTGVLYRGLTWLASGGSLVSQGILALMTAMSVAIALASGVILGEYVAQPLKREARRLETRLAGPRMVGPIRAMTRAERRAAKMLRSD